jgi:hypothetical protein
MTKMSNRTLFKVKMKITKVIMNYNERSPLNLFDYPPFVIPIP